MIEKRLKEINERKLELRNQIDLEGTDLEAINNEVNTLIEEEKELRKKAEIAKNLECTAVPQKEAEGEKRSMENQVFTLKSPEYRNAWLKNLMGKKLTEVEERAAGVITSVEGAAAIPTETMNLIIQAFEQNAVLYNLVSVSNIKGNVSFVVAPASSDAEWHGGAKEATDKDGEKLVFTSVTLSGYELIKVLEVSAKMEAMSIPAFELWVVQELAKKTILTIEKAIISGTGTDQPTGILKAGYITQTADFTKAGMTYKDILSIIAELPTGYLNNAVFCMPRKLFYGEVLGLEDKNGNPVVVQDVQAPAKFNILGYPVLVNDYMPEDTIVFGDFSTIKLNFAAPIEVTSDLSVGFKSGKKTFRSLTVVDCKPTLAEAFVLSKRKATA